jgi:hypothetical protein
VTSPHHVAFAGGYARDELEDGVSETGTYFLCILGQRCVFLDGLLDRVFVGDFEQREADDLGHSGGMCRDGAVRNEALLVSVYL